VVLRAKISEKQPDLFDVYEGDGIEAEKKKKNLP